MSGGHYPWHASRAAPGEIPEGRPVNDFLRLPHSNRYSGLAVDVALAGFVPYLSNQLRKYSCVLRKFDGVLDVP